MSSWDESTRESLERAGRLAALGVEIRSGELHAQAVALREFQARGGNRAMRRAAKRARRGKAGA